MPSTHPHYADVLAALQNMRYPAGLRNSPLLDLPAIRAKLPLRGGDAASGDLAVALGDLLSKTIDKMRPPGEENLRQREWLRYYILHHLYRRGDPNQTVQDVLGISRSYLYVLRNEASDALATLLFATPQTHVSLSEPIPVTADFVGRQAELAAYRRQLKSQRLAVIHGFAGTGKTALAAQLAAEHRAGGQGVIWITFSPGINTELDGFLDALGVGLEELGHNELRSFLLSRTRSAASYPADARISFAVNSLVATQVALCLDDIHLVDSVPELQRFLAGLIPRQQPARTVVIATSRAEPPVCQGRYIPALQGLTDQDCRLLLRQDGVAWLSDKLYWQLQQQIAGNAAYLKFFTAWAQHLIVEEVAVGERDTKAQAFISQIGGSLSSHRFLLDGAISLLQEQERSILDRIALSRKPINLESSVIPHLFADLELVGVQGWLSQLERRHVLMRSGETLLYRVHDLVKTYIVAQLTPLPQYSKHLHRLLASYYGALEDHLERAYHLCRSDDAPAAAHLLVEHSESFIQKGQAAAITNLAQEIRPSVLPAELRFRWYEVLARATWVAGQHDWVSHLYTEGLTWTDLSPEHRATFYKRLASTKAYKGLYDEAISHCQEGLGVLPAKAARGREWILLTMELASIEMSIGNKARARTLGLEAIEAMETNPPLIPDLGRIYGNYGAICYGCSDLEGAENYTKHCLDILQAANDVPALAMTMNNLACILQRKGELQHALEVNVQAEAMFNRLSDTFGIATCCNTRAEILIDLGLAETSIPILSKALDLSQQMRNRAVEASVLLLFGKAHVALNEVLAAMNYFHRARTISLEIGHAEVHTEAEMYLQKLLANETAGTDFDSDLL